MEKQLLAGFARVDITPTESVPLAGFGNSSARMSQSVLSPLYSSCLAVTGKDGTTVIFFHNDLCTTPVEFSDPVRKGVSEATGVPYANIMVTATHNHTSPDLNNRREPNLVHYVETATRLLVQCAVEAMADRRPAALQTAKGQMEGLNFVRHYILSDGTYKGDNFGTLNKNPIVGHATQADGEMRLVKFCRNSGGDIWLANFQGHPHKASGPKKYEISADLIGAMREEVEETENCRFLYFSGASGNLNCASRIAEENRYGDWQSHGKALAACALQAKFKTVEGEQVRVCAVSHSQSINRPDPKLLAHAREIAELWRKTNDSKIVVPLAVSYGINSPYAANSIVRRSAMKEDSLDILMDVACIGDVGFVFASYEMFDTNGKYIREHSPFETTVIATYANDQNSYIPSSIGFGYGCYESDLCFFKPGTGEKLADQYVQMLQNLTEVKNDKP